MTDQKRVSFRQKTETICPVCSNEFHREELLSGGGRLIAGRLTDELRRKYEASKKFGKIYPMAFVVTVCPSCYYSSFHKDFTNLQTNEIHKLREMTSARKNAVRKFFGNIAFEDDREIQLGAASYMLNVDCYTVRNKKVAPTFKMALSSIRAAWLFADLAEEFPQKPYKKISLFFYKKSYELYVKVLDIMQSGEESLDAIGNMGPDTDKNWGYDGLLYLTAILTVKIGSKDPDINKRIENFNKCKKYLSRLFGIGKTSKSKPSELLDMTKDLFDKINEGLEEWTQNVENGTGE